LSVVTGDVEVDGVENGVVAHEIDGGSSPYETSDDDEVALSSGAGDVDGLKGAGLKRVLCDDDLPVTLEVLALRSSVRKSVSRRMLGVLGVWANGGKGKASIRTEEYTRLAFAEGGEAEQARDSGSNSVRPTSVIERSGEEGCHGSRDAINAGFRRDLMMISLARIAQQNNVISETTPIGKELRITSVTEGDLIDNGETCWVEE